MVDLPKRDVIIAMHKNLKAGSKHHEHSLMGSVG